MVEVTGLKELNTYLSTLPLDMFELTKKAVGASTLSVHKTITGNFLSGETTGGSDKLHNRTGTLRRSLKTSLKGSDLNTLSSSVYTDVIYAPIHEVGGTIKAIDKYVSTPGGPYLNMPLSANLTAAGVMRQNAGEVFAGGGYIVKSKAGNYLVMSGSNIPMFVLKKSVTIRARLGMEKAMQDEIPTLLGNLERAIQNRLSEE